MKFSHDSDYTLPDLIESKLNLDEDVRVKVFREGNDKLQNKHAETFEDEQNVGIAEVPLPDQTFDFKNVSRKVY